MLIATVAYFKKAKRAWVAFLPEKEKVFLPQDAQKILEGQALRDARHSEARPRPSKDTRVVLIPDANDTTQALVWAVT